MLFLLHPATKGVLEGQQFIWNRQTDESFKGVIAVPPGGTIYLIAGMICYHDCVNDAEQICAASSTAVL